MNKKLILPLVIGAGVIGLYFLMKNKKPQLVSVAPPLAEPTTTTAKPLTYKEIIAKYKKFASV